MSRGRFTWRFAAVVLTLLLVSAGTAVAQVQSGNLYGTVTDSNGASLPGVTITLAGVGADQIQITNAEGQFRFLGLSPGDYELDAQLDGFSPVEYTNINIRVGRSSTIEITLNPAIEDVITVTSEGPLLDERKISAGTSITEIELEKIPTARDPWSLLTQAPGVQTDRINVGGNESGQQSVFVGTGSSSDENSFSVDGVVITDMAAVGSSPTYYDFDAFEEVQLTTGGSDISSATGGVTVNVVTKRGTNEWRGSGRYFLTDESYQADPDLDPSDFPVGQDPDTFTANSIDRIEDVGFEAGGPIVRDRLWVWGAFGENDINNVVAGGGLDSTTIENYNVKFNAQIAAPNSAVLQWSEGNKIKDGRGAGLTRPQATTWDQDGPTEVYKLEDTHVFSSNFYLTGLYSYVDGGFALAPKGGLEAETVWDSNGIWQNSFLDRDFVRPSNQYRVDGSYFFNTGSLNHEVRFGGGYRDFESAATDTWPGRGVINVEGENFGIGGQTEILIATRPQNTLAETEYTSAWAQDTLTAGNLTANLGLRYDLQQGSNLPSTLAGNPVASQFLPELAFQGNDPGFEWETITPRLGLTYALGEERKTLVRASYARFAQQLSTAYITAVNPVAAASVYYFYTDANNDDVFNDGETLSTPFRFVNVDPNNPTSLSSLNQIDPNLDPQLTDELIVGLEHAFMPELVGGISVTYREISDIIEARQLVFDENGNLRVATANDYILDGTVSGTLPNGQAFNEPFYTFRPGLSSAGATRTVNGSRGQEYLGIGLNFTKRLANRWMARGNVTWYDWTWDVPASFRAFDDPTDAVGGGDNDGAIVAEQSAGSGNKGGIWLNSQWSANLNGLYQIAPDRAWGFNVAGNINAREGFVNPLFVLAQPTNSAGINVAAADFDAFRNDDIVTFDIRLDKDFEFGDFGFTLSADVFNLFNEAYVLQRQRNQNLSTANQVQETLSPQVFRLGLRLHFR